MTQNAYSAAKAIQKIKPGFSPKIGIILGSGLGTLADCITDKTVISYEQLPGFPIPTVKGHGGKLILGQLQDKPVICLQGRNHYYESLSYEPVKTYIRTLKLLGCHSLLATNASGSLREDIGPGELVLIEDHINFQPGNPLAGINDDDFGPRFPALTNAYDKQLREHFTQIARQQSIDLHQGVYLAVPGPSYETAAEIKAFRIWGATAVGMSTVPEVIVANHCGMKVSAIAIITNFATGLSPSEHSHDAVVSMANSAAEKLTRLVSEYIKEYA